jgi:hypothetical protein
MPTQTKTLQNQQPGPAARRRLLILDIVLWTIATIVMLAAFVYQKETGPTELLKGAFAVDNKAYHYKLLRSQGGPGNATVKLPDPGVDTSGELMYRRLGLDEPFTAVPLMREKGLLYADLPHQPPAGKLEYYFMLNTPSGQLNVPSGRMVVIRFKGDVPVKVLLPHILFMFFGMLFCVRTALEVFHPGARLRRLAWYTLALLGVGGMIFGPIVQKYAFGQYWTGVPFGWDLTDNKLLILVLFWIGAVVALGWPRTPVKPLARWLCVLAALLTVLVYLIPHSLHGSTLDYRKLEQGVPAEKAVTQR